MSPTPIASVFPCDYLPGALRMERGGRCDYRELERFHYLPRRPATFADVWVVRYAERLVAIGILSFPVACLGGRQRWFGQKGWSYGAQLRWANANVRTISRVIVHPQFRGLGLASGLVRQLMAVCSTRHVEAIAQMGRAHPFFEQAGMTRVEPLREGEGVYFVFDRAATPAWRSAC